MSKKILKLILDYPITFSTILGLTFLTILLVAFESKGITNFRENPNLENYIHIAAAASALITIGYVTFKYLNGSKKGSIFANYVNEIDEDKKLDQRLDSFLYYMDRQNLMIQETLDSIQISIQENRPQEQKVELKFDNKDDILDEFKKSFSESINSDFFSELHKSIANQVTFERLEEIRSIRYLTNDLKKRLSGEIDKVNRKSNVNLAIGSIMTIVALICLGYTIFTKPISLENSTTILSHYIPRISFIVFIEIFAFFFLKLYKLNINDVKYYHNELTNVDLKTAGLMFAINFGKENDISVVTNDLSKTERNFVLEKGQTTIDLERFKSETRSADKYFDMFKVLFKERAGN